MSFFIGFKKGMREFGESVSMCVNSLLLLIVYITGIGITAIAAKLFKKRFLEKELGKETYWSELNIKKKPLEEYYRQF